MSSATDPRRVTRTDAATLAALALAAPAATARPPIDQLINPPPESAAAPTARAPDGSFDWGAAGIGAATAGGLVLVAAGGFAAAHSGRTRVAP